MFIGAIYFNKPTTQSLNSGFLANKSPANVPIDQLASTNIALNIAEATNLPEQVPIRNQADSQAAYLNSNFISGYLTAKSQIIQSSYISNKNIQTYIVQPNDTINSIAQKFGLNANSIIWSNNISGNYVTAGMKLLIPPMNGIVYTVKAGDTLQSIASKYQVSTSQILADNDAQLSGLKPGEQIILPNGQAPVVVNYYSANIYPTYGYNGYDYGYCTWWVANLMAEHGIELPTNLGNASTWAINAAAFGIPVSSTPKVGSAVVMSTYGEGHVGYVTAVNANGTITVSEMNHIGWDITDSRTVPSAGFQYIY